MPQGSHDLQSEKCVDVTGAVLSGVIKDSTLTSCSHRLNRSVHAAHKSPQAELKQSFFLPWAELKDSCHELS